MAKQRMIRQAICVVKDRFIKAKGENAVVETLTTRRRSDVARINIPMTVQLSIAVGTRFYNAMAKRGVAGTTPTTKLLSFVAAEVFIIKATKRTLVVAQKLTTLM